MSKFIPDLPDETLRYLVEALTESGQAVCIFDAEDNLRYANKTYQGMFLGNYDGPFTFAGITRHAHRNGLGVRIDDGACPASPLKPISWMAAGSGSTRPFYRTPGFCLWVPTSRP